MTGDRATRSALCGNSGVPGTGCVGFPPGTGQLPTRLSSATHLSHHAPPSVHAAEPRDLQVTASSKERVCLGKGNREPPRLHLVFICPVPVSA